MRTRLKWVAIRAFRSFVDRTVINFPETGIVLVRGLNRETGGSSGTGKTSINLAINYALGICHLPATNLQSWLTETPMQVELCLDTSEGEVIITRGEKFVLSVNGHVMKGGNKILEEKLQQIIGLPSELLEALTYRRQMTRGQFLSKANGDKQSFLTVLLGLQKYEAAIEQTNKNITSLEPKRALLLEDVRLCQEEVDRHQKLVGDPALLDEVPYHMAVSGCQDEIKSLETKIEQTEAAIAQAKLAIQEQTDKIIRDNIPKLQGLEFFLQGLKNAPLPVVDRTEEERLNELLSQAKGFLEAALVEDQKVLEAERDHARELQGQLDQARKDLIHVEQLKKQGRACLEQIAELEKSVCFNCLQPWVKAVDQKKQLEDKMVEIANAIEERQLEGCLDGRINRLEVEVQVAWKHTPNPDIKKLEAIEVQLRHQCADIEQANDRMEQDAQSERDMAIAQAELALKSAQTEATMAAQVHQGNSLERLQRPYEELDGYRSALKLVNSRLQGCQNEAHQASLRNAEARHRAETEIRLLQEALKRLETAQARAAEVTGRLAAEEDFLALVGRQGFLGAIYDEVLWEVSDETNRILSGIPNTAHVLVNFKSETLTQKGKISKEIVPVATINGHEAPLKAGCSGGMYGAVELAVDLAVGAVVSRRTGAVPNWVILDEAFEGLGPIEKAGCLEILQSCAADKLILVVDHASEIKEAYPQTIDVEYSHEVSRLV